MSKKIFAVLICVPLTIVISMYSFDSSTINVFQAFFQSDSLNEITPQKIIVAYCPIIVFGLIFSTFIFFEFSSASIYFLIRRKSRHSIFFKRILQMLILALINTIGFIAAIQITALHFYNEQLMPFPILYWVKLSLSVWITTYILAVVFNIINLSFTNNLSTAINMIIIIFMVFWEFLTKNTVSYINDLNPLYCIAELVFNDTNNISVIIQLSEAVIFTWVCFILIKLKDIGLNRKEQ